MCKFVPTRIKSCQTSSIQNGVFEVELCWSRLANANTLKPGARIPIYMRYGCVPLTLKGKGFSVPVVHPHPTSHKVPLASHTWRHPPDTRRQTPTPCTSAVILGLRHHSVTSITWRHRLKIRLLHLRSFCIKKWINRYRNCKLIDFATLLLWFFLFFSFEPSGKGRENFHSSFGFVFRFLLMGLTTFSKNPH